MAKIEIDMEEYNSYHTTIDRLNREKFELLKSISQKNEEIESLSDNIEIAKNANFFDRIFGWKQIKRLISKE